MSKKCVVCGRNSGLGDVCWEHAYMLLHAQTEPDEDEIEEILGYFGHSYDKSAPAQREAMQKTLKLLNAKRGIA